MYLLIKPGNTFSSCVTGANLAKHWTSRVFWLNSTGSIGSGPSTLSVSCGCTSLELEDCAAMVKWHWEMIVTTTLGDDSNTHLSNNCNDRHWLEHRIDNHLINENMPNESTHVLNSQSLECWCSKCQRSYSNIGHDSAKQASETDQQRPTQQQ